MSARGAHNPPEFKHAAEMEWEMGRFGNVTKFLFHPRPERPTEPNAGFLKYAPGASFPLHRHDFAQVWYIIDGEFSFAGKLYGPGTIAYMPDPHFEHEMHTTTGGTIFFVQYPGPTTGAPSHLRWPHELEGSALASAAGLGALMRASYREARQDGRE
jgi:hypothetical protein